MINQYVSDWARILGVYGKKGGRTMQSVVMYTEELDDLADAAEDLFRQAAFFSLQKNSLGIIFADEEMNYLELYGYLRKKWTFPIVGTTAIATLVGEWGYQRSGISMMLLTADDCTFLAGMTSVFTSETYEQEIQNTYTELVEALPAGENVKLILTYGCKVDWMIGDHIVDVLEKTAGKTIPIYGALASDVLNFTNARIYLNNREEATAQVLVLVSGNLDPKYIAVQSVSSKANVSYQVTKAKGNRVFRLGRRTFLDALRRAGLSVEKENVNLDYILSPFVVVLKKENGMTIEVSRNLVALNLEEESGDFLGGVPEGSSLEIGLLNREDVQTSVEQAFQKIASFLADVKTSHKTILCTSCAARFLALGGDGAVEAESYQAHLPENTALLGMYSYGEFCPVKSGERFSNSFHNETFTILLL